MIRKKCVKKRKNSLRKGFTEARRSGRGQEKMNQQDEILIKSWAPSARGRQLRTGLRLLTEASPSLQPLWQGPPEGKDHPHMWRLTYKLNKKLKN